MRTMINKIDFEVFWNENDRITIRQRGFDMVVIHPSAIGHLYGMMKETRDDMEAKGLKWKEVE